MLKPSTQQLIDSFRYRRQWLPKNGRPTPGETMTVREDEALWARLNRKCFGSSSVRHSEINQSKYRQHLATLHTV